MKPPAAAQRIAARAISNLTEPPPGIAGVLAQAIADGRDLDDDQVHVVRSFFANTTAAASTSGRMAAAMLGGPPMARAVARAAATTEEALGKPDPGPHTGAMIALVPDAHHAGLVAVDDGLPPDDLHVTLAYLGAAADVPDLARAEVVRICEQMAADLDGGLTAIMGHVSHMDQIDEPAAVAYDLTAPKVHLFRRDLVVELTAAGVDWANRYAFRPHMTLTYIERETAELEAWPEGPVDEPQILPLTGLLVRFDDDETRTIPLPGHQQHQISPVAAAGDVYGYSALPTAVDALNASLGAMHDVVTAEVRTAIDISWRSALERVGRVVTRHADAYLQMPAEQAAVRAAADDLASIAPHPAKLIAPAVTDASRHISAVLARAQAETLGMIGDTFGVDLTGLYPSPALATAWVEQELATAIEAALGSLSEPGRIDPADGDHDPLIPPTNILRDTLAMAGGADVVDGRVNRDEAGRPIGHGFAGGDSVPLGPAAMAAVFEAITAWAGDTPVVAAAKRRRGIAISDSLRTELADAANRMTNPDGPTLEQVTVHVWTINANGTAETNLDRHLRMAGTTITKESDLLSIDAAAADPNVWPYTATSTPGDHNRCHCAWVPRITLVPVQLQLAA